MVQVLAVVVPNARESVLPENVSGYESVAAPVTPLPLVERMEFWMLEMVRLDVEAVPETARLPVVVAPPLIVSPVPCPPAPMVELAYAVIPPLNWTSVVVALPAA